MLRLVAFLRSGRFGFGSLGAYGAAIAGIFAAYVIVLALSLALPPGRLLLTAAANVVPMVLLAGIVRLVLLRFVVGATAARQAALHGVLGLLFTLLFFWLVMVLLGVLAGHNAVEFSVRPFRAPAAAWQLFQGLLLYCLIAVAVHAEAFAARSQPAPGAAAARSDRPARLFVKQGDEIRPVDAQRIILVRGADDYSEVVTAAGTHLVRMTLASLAATLGDRFVRVHRSCLVNLDRVAKVEPAGSGRFLLHMEGGDVIQASRTGSRALREHFV